MLKRCICIGLMLYLQHMYTHNTTVHHEKCFMSVDFIANEPLHEKTNNLHC